MLQRFADTLVLSWGKRRAALAFFFGALAALAQAPVHAFPVLFVALPALVWLLDGALSDISASLWTRMRSASFVGWWFGFGYFLAGLWWIGGAFLVEAEDFGWMMPFAVLIMPAGLALFWALGVAMAATMWRDGWRRVLALTIGLAVVEWLRGHVLTGFPWNAIGYGFAANSLMMQPVALVGLYGLNFIAVLIFASPAVLADSHSGSRRGAYGFPLFVCALFAGCLIYGAARLGVEPSADVENVRLRLVQPAIAQEEKWRPENRNWIFKTYLEMSVGADRAGVSGAANGADVVGLDGITHLIWPESVFPFLLTEQPEALAALADLLPEGTTLITGAARAEGETRPRDYYNSIYVLDDDGTIQDAYDKVHLVPFGEYLPLRSWLEALGLENLTKVPGGFTPGFRRKAMSAAGVPDFSPLICYEIAFPGDVVDRAKRPGWMLNVTNDAWFGETAGPYQHLHQARVRAVEEGLPVVRAANTGISAVIDARGRMRARIALGDSGILDAGLPKAEGPTLYVRFGDWPLLAFLLLSLCVLLRGPLRQFPRPD